MQCSVDDSLPKRICYVCMNSVRSAYCFKLQSETSYKTLIEQFGSGCTKIKIEYCDDVPEQKIDHEENDQKGIVRICHLIQINLNSKVVTFLSPGY